MQLMLEVLQQLLLQLQLEYVQLPPLLPLGLSLRHASE